MGGESSKHQDEKKVHHGALGAPKKSVDPRIEAAFSRLSNGGDEINYKYLMETLNEDVAKGLWKYFVPSKPFSETITKEEFAAKAEPLAGNSTDVYVGMFLPAKHLLKVCSEAAGAEAIHGDEEFITRLTKEMTSLGDTATSVAEWKRASCPKFCNALQAAVLEKLFNYDNPSIDYASDILTPLQMWFLQCSLPAVYFPKRDQNSDDAWTPLYTSLQHGISTNRFEALVFDYKGPTVSLFRLKDGRTVALATDQEWRHSSNRFGGPATCFFELFPKLSRTEASSSIYCNLKIRSASFGVSFKEIMKIDKDFDAIFDIEVWGCASANTLNEQKKLKTWQKQQAEKHKKVPLPGKWDENPDKTLLEMAGFQFSNERQLMELESKH